MFSSSRHVRNGMRTVYILSVCGKCLCTFLALMFITACSTTDKTLTLHQTEAQNLFRNVKSQMDVDFTIAPVKLPLSVTDSDTSHRPTPMPVHVKGTIKVKTEDTVATVATNQVESSEHIKRGVQQNTSIFSIGKPFLVVLCIIVIIFMLKGKKRLF